MNKTVKMGTGTRISILILLIVCSFIISFISFWVFARTMPQTFLLPTVHNTGGLTDFWMDSRIIYRIFSPDGNHYNASRSESVEHLRASSSYIIRAEVVSAMHGDWSVGDDTIHYHYFYTIYRVHVLDVFQGFVQKGDTIEIIQYRRRRGYTKGNLDFEGYFHHVPFEIGDDVLLFLLNSNNDLGRPAILVNSLQGAYRYVPREIRIGYDNWEFESLRDERVGRVSPNLNLTITEEDLFQIRERDS